MKRTASSVFRIGLVLVSGVLGSCSDESAAGPAVEHAVQTSTPPLRAGETPHFAYITNGAVSFWVIAGHGAEAAAKDRGAKLTILTPGNPVDQQQAVEDMLTRGVHGLALSPIDPDNQTAMIDRAAARTRVLTQDSDAPRSNRICFVGVDNYVAGRMCGDLVKEALPDGGEVMIFIGRTEQDNARRRRQGVIDAILDRSFDPGRHDPVDDPVGNGRYRILGTMTDQFERARAKANVEDALTAHPELDCLVGLFAYNPPACLEALARVGKLGKVRVVAFDEADETLQGIKDGTVFATVVQDPYGYGYRSIEMLDKITRGDLSAVPDGRFLDLPARKIYPQDVDAFWAELRSKLAGGDGK